MEYDTLIMSEIENSVAVITINNPPVNALSGKMITEMKHCLSILEEGDETRALVIFGAGTKAFMGGADITELPEILKGGRPAAKAYAQNGHTLFDAVANFNKPTIAAVNGFALGGGCELALACDIRIASRKALFGLPEIKLGIIPGGGGTQRLPRLIGEAKAKELMFLGKTIDADSAHGLGLVNHVVEPGDVLKESVALAEKIAARPLFAVQAIKRCVDAGSELRMNEGLKLEIDCFAELFLSQDADIGVTAFIEKNKPEFKHN